MHRVVKRPRISRFAIRSVGLVAGIAATCTLMIPSQASASTTPAPDELGSRLERACLRIPNIETRTNNVIARLQGDATVRGSLAWLRAQIERAEARGRTDLVEVLTNRLAVREQTLVVLQLRLDGLPALEAFCIERGVAL
jgi:hypothetical protein